MADLVSTGGSRGVPVLGGEMQASLTNSILRLADTEINKNIAETRAKQYMHGKARVAQGESLETIRASQTVYDQIFGAGTLQGAEAQTIIQATDEHILHMQTNMYKYKEIPTEQFISQQTDYVTANLLTGNRNIDDLIVLASAEAVSDSSRIHAKEHQMFVQQKNKLAFETTLTGASTRLHNILINPKMSFDDKMVALQNLEQRIQKMPGQHQDAYITSLAETIVTELANDRPELYMGLMHGAIVVDNQVVATGERLNFGKDTNAGIKEAFVQHRERVDSDAKIDEGMQLAGLTLLAENLSVPDSEVATAATLFLDVHGADARTEDQIKQLFLDRARSRLKADSTSQDVKDYHTGASRTAAGERGKWEDIANLHEQQVMDRASKGNPDDIDQRAADATAFVLQRAVQNRIVPSGWSARWNDSFENMLEIGGKDNIISDTFIQELQHFNSKHQADPDLFESALTDKARANVLAVKSMLQSEKMNVPQAVLAVRSWQLPPQEAAELVKTKDFSDQVDEFLDNPSNRLIFPEMDVQNEIQVRRAFKQLINNQVAKTGLANEKTWPATRATFIKKHEKVSNQQIHNQGTPLNAQAGMLDPDASFDDALTHFVYNDREVAGWRQTASKMAAAVLPSVEAPKFQGLFGEGADPEFYQYKFEPGYVTITPFDEDGGYLIGSDNAGKRIPLQAIGKIYNEEVTGPSIERSIKRTKDVDKILRDKFFVGLDIEDAGSYNLESNKDAVEYFKGSPVTGDAVDNRILKNLQDPDKSVKINSLLKTVKTQISNGNLNGMLSTMKAVGRLTEDTPQEGDNE